MRNFERIVIKMIKKIFSYILVFICFFVYAILLVACGDEAKTTNASTTEEYEVGSVQNLEFEIFGEAGNESLYCSVVGYKTFYNDEKDNNIIIPSKYKGIPVRSIGESAFSECNSLTSVEIPSSVTNIEDYAFEHCYSLTNISISSSVTYIGDYAFDDCDKLQYNEYDNAYYLGNKENPYVVLIKVKDDGIEQCLINSNCRIIGEYAFEGCTSLTSVEIPATVTNIGDYAFKRCYKLTNITIPSSVTNMGDNVFDDCYKLQYNEYDNAYYLGNKENPYVVLIKVKNTDIEQCLISKNCRIIGDYAFYLCKSITGVEIPATVVSIGFFAFGYCSILSNIEISSNVTSIGGRAFEGCSRLASIEIPSKVASIGESAFYGCSSLTSIDIPSSVTKIRDSAFRGCSSLISIKIPSSITKIGDYAFCECIRLISVEIPSRVKSIGAFAFTFCNNLTNITIPEVVTMIGEGAFSCCNSLTSIIVAGNNLNYKSIDGNLYTIDEKELIQYAVGKQNKSFAIPSSVTSIGNFAFRECSNLINIEIPSSVTSIGKLAFSECSSLTNVEIPSKVTSIENWTFSGCDNLTNIIIPSSVRSIGDWGFNECGKLTTVFYTGNSEQWSSMYIFSANSDLTSATIYYYSEAKPTEAGNYWHYDENREIVIWTE